MKLYVIWLLKNLVSAGIDTSGSNSNFGSIKDPKIRSKSGREVFVNYDTNHDGVTMWTVKDKKNLINANHLPALYC